MRLEPASRLKGAAGKGVLVSPDDMRRPDTLSLAVRASLLKSKDVVIVKMSTQPQQVDMDMFIDAFAAMDSIAENLATVSVYARLLAPLRRIATRPGIKEE